MPPLSNNQSNSRRPSRSARLRHQIFGQTPQSPPAAYLPSTQTQFAIKSAIAHGLLPFLENTTKAAPTTDFFKTFGVPPTAAGKTELLQAIEWGRQQTASLASRYNRPDLNNPSPKTNYTLTRDQVDSFAAAVRDGSRNQEHSLATTFKATDPRGVSTTPPSSASPEQKAASSSSTTQAATQASPPAETPAPSTPSPAAAPYSPARSPTRSAADSPAPTSTPESVSPSAAPEIGPVEQIKADLASATQDPSLPQELASSPFSQRPAPPFSADSYPSAPSTDSSAVLPPGSDLTSSPPSDGSSPVLPPSTSLTSPASVASPAIGGTPPSISAAVPTNLVSPAPFPSATAAPAADFAPDQPLDSSAAPVPGTLTPATSPGEAAPASAPTSISTSPDSTPATSFQPGTAATSPYVSGPTTSDTYSQPPATSEGGIVSPPRAPTRAQSDERPSSRRRNPFAADVRRKALRKAGKYLGKGIKKIGQHLAMPLIKLIGAALAALKSALAALVAKLAALLSTLAVPIGIAAAVIIIVFFICDIVFDITGLFSDSNLVQLGNMAPVPGGASDPDACLIIAKTADPTTIEHNNDGDQTVTYAFTITPKGENVTLNGVCSDTLKTSCKDGECPQPNPSDLTSEVCSDIQEMTFDGALPQTINTSYDYTLPQGTDYTLTNTFQLGATCQIKDADGVPQDKENTQTVSASTCVGECGGDYCWPTDATSLSTVSCDRETIDRNDGRGPVAHGSHWLKDAIDIPCVMDATIYAPFTGHFDCSSNSGSGWGNHARATDAEGRSWLLAHFSRMCRSGDYQIGQPLATCGCTGNSIGSHGGCGTHLHLQTNASCNRSGDYSRSMMIGLYNQGNPWVLHDTVTDYYKGFAPKCN